MFSVPASIEYSCLSDPLRALAIAAKRLSESNSSLKRAPEHAQVAEEDIEAWQISGAMTNIIFRCQNLKTCQVSVQHLAFATLASEKLKSSEPPEVMHSGRTDARWWSVGEPGTLNRDNYLLKRVLTKMCP